MKDHGSRGGPGHPGEVQGIQGMFRARVTHLHSSSHILLLTRSQTHSTLKSTHAHVHPTGSTGNKKGSRKVEVSTTIQWRTSSTCKGWAETHGKEYFCACSEDASTRLRQGWPWSQSQTAHWSWEPVSWTWFRLERTALKAVHWFSIGQLRWLSRCGGACVDDVEQREPYAHSRLLGTAAVGSPVMRQPGSRRREANMGIFDASEVRTPGDSEVLPKNSW